MIVIAAHINKKRVENPAYPLHLRNKSPAKLSGGPGRTGRILPTTPAKSNMHASIKRNISILSFKKSPPA